MEYFVLRGTDTEGPVSEEDLRRALAEGELTENDLVRTDASRLWTRLGKVLEEPEATPQPALPPLAWPPAGSGAKFPTGWSWDRAALVRQVEEAPVPIGIAAIVVACVLALLARWPILLVLPGIALGVGCGLVLIVRNRPIVGGLLSLAALLLPLALLPSPPPAPIPAELRAPEASTGSFEPSRESLVTPAPPAPPAPTASAPERAAPPDAAPLAPPPSLAAAEPPAPVPAELNTPATPPLPSTVPLPAQPQDVIYRIDTGKARGSGFIGAIGDKVYFFTNHHLLEGAEKVAVRGGVQPPQNLGAIIEIAEDRDVVRVPLSERAALHFATAAEAGEAVAAFGDSGGVPARIAATVVTADRLQLEMGAEFASASSGGPVLNAGDEVVGVATFSTGIENISAWIKTGARTNGTRRFAVRVTSDVRWERMLMTAYQLNSARVADMEAILTEILGFANQLSQKPFRSEISTRFPQRADLQGWVEAYNQSARTRMMPNQGKMRDYARRLMGTVRATQAALENDIRSPRLSPSKGYLKRREGEVLKSFGAVNDEIAKVFDVRS